LEIAKGGTDNGTNASKVQEAKQESERLLPWQVLAELRDHTGFANWDQNKEGCGTLEEHRDPSQCAGVTVNNSGEITKIDLSSSNLAGALPESFAQLSSLQALDLEGNKLTALSDSIGQLSSLDFLDCSSNSITALPDSIGNLQNMTCLIASSNEIKILPESIGQMSSLESLNVRGNKLTVLPDSIGQLSILSTLDLEGNNLTDAEKQRVRAALPGCGDLWL